MNDIEEAIYDALAVTALTNLVGTRIYRDAAPEPATYPLVVYAWWGGGDDNETPKRSRSPLYQVRAVSAVSADEAGDIATVIDALLHQQTLAVAGYTNYWTAQTSEIGFSEWDEQAGKRFWHRGAIYRIRVAQ